MDVRLEVEKSASGKGLMGEEEMLLKEKGILMRHEDDVWKV